jgi:hypothetical protein
VVKKMSEFDLEEYEKKRERFRSFQLNNIKGIGKQAGNVSLRKRDTEKFLFLIKKSKENFEKYFEKIGEHEYLIKE